ncbi:uncharacterized protein LOC112566219 isoform X5 [Pomacea canaliculata]|uniref:uncharacterized protein LOC112566219 isoform X5 n=1 Tax=Pomacea canaliculata TaxID=400727 RepID=UPI000D732C9D|nr:uncharacterized protein LOC112566219 isoform X5 [Pomacea canaliculata]
MEYSVDLLIISMSKEKEGVKLRSAGDASIFSVCSGVPPNVPPALTSRSPRRRAVDGFHRWPGTRSGAAGEKIPVSKTMGLKCKPGNVRSRTSAAAISCNRTAISIISAATTTGATRKKSPLHVQCRGAVAMPYHDEMRPLPRPVSPTGRGADACAVARGGKLTRSRRPINPIPRHKRDSHINAEYRRRNKIQRGFEVVRTLVPVLREADPATRESKASMLNKCAAFIREVTEECRHQDEEAMSLRQEVDNLRKELDCVEPSAGCISSSCLRPGSAPSRDLRGRRRTCLMTTSGRPSCRTGAFGSVQSRGAASLQLLHSARDIGYCR